MLLKVKNLTKVYGEKKAVDDVSFELEENNILCILGPSGCGKTTVLNMIGGFTIPNKGTIMLSGEDITNFPPEKRSTSTVFQSYGLFYNMNVLDNVSYGLKFKNLQKDEIKKKSLEMIEMVGLKGNENKMMNELSGGMRQRVALARSLVINPKLLLLDEPLSNLDQKLRVSMRSLIKEVVKKMNIATIFVTHDQGEAFELADSIILMNEGKIMQMGTAMEIYNHPKSNFVETFIGERNIIDGKTIRPEDIKITPGAPNSKIKDIIFQGSFIKLLLEYKDSTIESFILNEDIDFKIGEDIHIEIKSK